MRCLWVDLLGFTPYRYWDNTTPYVANRDIVGQVVTVDVNDKKWHYRVPYYGRYDLAAYSHCSILAYFRMERGFLLFLLSC